MDTSFNVHLELFYIILTTFAAKLHTMSVTKTAIKVKISKVLNIRHLNDTTFVLQFERGEFDFEAGQYIALGLKGKIQKREYSIYSGSDDPYLEILVKEVLDGDVSKRLKTLKPGDELEVQGPFGYFTIDEKVQTRDIVFIASGTGISPCHSLIKSLPSLSFTMLHGIRTADERYEMKDYSSKGKYIACTSREGTGDYYGRVTDYLNQADVDLKAAYYLCGNSNMIYDVFDVLKGAGVPQDQIHTEVYF